MAALAWRIGVRIETLLAATEDDPPDVDEQTEALLAEQARAPLLLPPSSTNQPAASTDADLNARFRSKVFSR